MIENYCKLLLMFLLMNACSYSTQVQAGSWFITNVDLSTEYEHVNQDGFDKDANALTFRARPSIRTKSFNGFSATLEAEIIIGNDQYNSTDNGVIDRPVVSIPEDEEINQLLLAYKADNLTTKLGRQRILLNNGRIIGNVGWRQNEQTMDALSLDFNSGWFNGFYAYVDKVNRLFGNSHSNPVRAEFDTSAHLLNTSYNFSERQKVTGYAYLIDNESVTELSSQTFGVAYKGIYRNMLIETEFAKQLDYADASNKNESYFKFEATLHHRGLNFIAGHERLSGNGTVSFDTPLSNWHEFNGWTDQFIAIPDNGLKDSYAAISGRVLGLTLTTKYHNFSAENGGSAYGNELGFAARKDLKNGKLVAKYASYNADGFATDTDKFWLTWRYNFSNNPNNKFHKNSYN